jgi:hypothetical protein
MWNLVYSRDQERKTAAKDRFKPLDQAFGTLGAHGFTVPEQGRAAMDVERV